MVAFAMALSLRGAAPYLLLGAAGVAVLALLRQGTASASEAAGSGLQPGESVLFVGDSLGVGTASRLGALLPQNPYTSLVHGGWTAKDVLAALSASDAAGSVAVVSLGSNDAALFAGEGAAVSDLAALLRARGARRIFWLVPPNFTIASPPAPATRAKQDAFRAIMSNAGAESIEPGPDVVAQLGQDRIHLAPAGYQAFAEESLAALSA